MGPLDYKVLSANAIVHTVSLYENSALLSCSPTLCSHLGAQAKQTQIYAHECKGLNASKQFQVWETVANAKLSVI